MERPRLFAALVTYRGSHFNRHGEAEEHLRALSNWANQAGFQVSGLVSDRDDFDPKEIRITRRLVIRSAALQAWMEFRWRRYLSHGRGDSVRSWVRDCAVLAAMFLRREWDYVGKNPLRTGTNLPGAGAIIRLLNIDLSHLRIYREALDSKANWILVIEDDARSVSRDAFVDAIRNLVSNWEPEVVRLTNLSESISPEVLGIIGILEAPMTHVEASNSLLAACSRPVTNTVCANMFSRKFVQALLDNIEAHGLTPVIPIDWRLNRMIMDEWARGSLDSTTCTWVVPGVFVQGSMHTVDGNLK